MPRQPEGLLTNKALVLLAVYIRPDESSFIEIAERLGISAKTVERSIESLEEEGLLERELLSRRNSYRVRTEKQFTKASAASVQQLLEPLAVDATFDEFDPEGRSIGLKNRIDRQ